MRTARFLPEPSTIRAALHGLTRKGGKLDIAVAFVGSDWWELIGNFSGNIRVICWLSSPNTNPYAVEEMLKRKNIIVKQRDSMHAKVYCVPETGTVIGSANLSKAALNEMDTAGQSEAAVLIQDPKIVLETVSWFHNLWTSDRTRRITDSDLSTAKDRWDRLRTLTLHAKSRNLASQKTADFPLLPTMPPILKALASKIKSQPIEQTLGAHYTFFSSLNPSTITRAQQKLIAGYLSEWVKRAWVSKRLKQESLSRIRQGLTILFDESKEISDRLTDIHKRQLLPGLRIPSLSLLLHWRRPKRYLPFDIKTKAFLLDFEIKSRGFSASSPVCYANWIRFSTRLGQWLELPSPGHVDRVIGAYYSKRQN